MFGILRNHNHVGAVLAQTENPINQVRRGIVAADDFAALGGEINFPIGDGESMRRTQGPEFHRRQGFLGHQVNHGERVPGTIVGNESQLAVGGSNDLMRIGPGGCAAHNLQTGGIHDRQRVVTFVEHEQGGGGRFVGGGHCRREAGGQKNQS